MLNLWGVIRFDFVSMTDKRTNLHRIDINIITSQNNVLNGHKKRLTIDKL